MRASLHGHVANAPRILNRLERRPRGIDVRLRHPPEGVRHREPHPHVGQPAGVDPEPLVDGQAFSTLITTSILAALKNQK